MYPKDLIGYRRGAQVIDRSGPLDHLIAVASSVSRAAAVIQLSPKSPKSPF
jgi:hypothetical protein